MTFLCYFHSQHGLVAVFYKLHISKGMKKSISFRDEKVNIFIYLKKKNIHMYVYTYRMQRIKITKIM